MLQHGQLDASLTYRQFKKVEFIIEQAKNGVKVAQEYESKLRVDRVSVEWAFKKVKEEVIAIEILSERLQLPKLKD